MAVKEPSKKDLLEENARLKQELKLMQQKLDLVLRQMFGRSSEKLSPDQMDLFLQPKIEDLGKAPASSLEEADPRHEGKEPRRSSRRDRVPEDLPVVEEVIEPAEVAAAPQDWKLIGAEVSEQLDYEPGRFYRRRLVRRKYVRRGDLFTPPSLPRCRRACRNAAWLRRGCWRRSSWENTATTFLFTARKRSLRAATESRSRGKPWLAGWH